MTGCVSVLLLFEGNCVILLAASHDTHSATTTDVVHWILGFTGGSLRKSARLSRKGYKKGGKSTAKHAWAIC